jgi:hypothetical protein
MYAGLGARVACSSRHSRAVASDGTVPWRAGKYRITCYVRCRGPAGTSCTLLAEAPDIAVDRRWRLAWFGYSESGYKSGNASEREMAAV